MHCSVLAEQAVKAALSDYYRRQGIDPEPIVGKLEEDCEHCEKLRPLILTVSYSKKRTPLRAVSFFASPLVKKGFKNARRRF